ncbi:MAG: hypothetical protein HQL30_12675 [Candidatus Omnitrophica bacterium]|nr:hypothetical protein [Candidatus Omnitrophota bacterium]
MGKHSFRNLGKQFYEWYRDGLVQFEYAGKSKDLVSEVERVTKLIDYVEKKKAALVDKM